MQLPALLWPTYRATNRTTNRRTWGIIQKLHYNQKSEFSRFNHRPSVRLYHHRPLWRKAHWSLIVHKRTFSLNICKRNITKHMFVWPLSWHDCLKSLPFSYIHSFRCSHTHKHIHRQVHTHTQEGDEGLDWTLTRTVNYQQ